MAQSWQFISSGSVTQSANPSIGVPTDFQAGDLLVICAVSNNQFTNSSPPSGWTASYTTNWFGTILYKLATGTETATALTNANSSSCGIMLAYRSLLGRDVTGATATSNGTQASTTSITTTTTDDLVISLFGFTAVSGGTITPPSSTNVRVQRNAASGVTGMLIVDENKATASSTTVRTATIAVPTAWSTLNASFTQSPNTYNGDMFLSF